MPKGIDLPSDAGRVIDAIRGADLDFVARYYRNPTSRWPSLSASEARLLTSAGLNVVAVWEAASTGADYFSRLSGVDDATSAYRQAHAIGQPPGSAIYFAVDYDATSGDVTGPITEYFQGIAAGFAAAGGTAPDYAVGVYGSGAVCAALVAAGLAHYVWLAMAGGWRGSRGFTAWHIKQGEALPGLAFGHDSDEATDDYGGFQVA